MLVYRILHKKYGDPLLAPGIEGRWNDAGKKVLYCSESVPLAFMESMIRRQGVGFNNDFQIACIEIPDDAVIKTIIFESLAAGWGDPYSYIECQKVARGWFDSMESLALKVPSSVLSVCYNYVLNTLHTDFIRVKLVAITPLTTDIRIEELLKKAK